jgi:hypothetical protein
MELLAGKGWLRVEMGLKQSQFKICTHSNVGLEEESTAHLLRVRSSCQASEMIE